MKRPLSILLLFALVYQCLGCLGVFAWYEANKHYIAEQLCENRDKPELHCDGKCVLMKKLNALEDNTDKQSTGTQSFTKLEASVFIVPLLQRVDAPISISDHSRYFPSIDNYQFLYFTDSFRPPRTYTS